MAESSFWEKSCESCLEEQKQTKARTLCFECHEFLCEECSNWHLRFKKSKSHHLIDLVPFTSNPNSSGINEDEMASDFLGNLTISDNTVLYSAQVAVEKKDVKTASKPEKDTKIDIDRLTVTKCLEFSIERPDDKAKLDVRGIVCLKDTVAVAVCHDDSVILLRMYDLQGHFLSSTHVSNHIWGMASIDCETFATCGSGYKVSIWRIDGQAKLNEEKAFKVESYMSQGINFNGTYYCVLHVDCNAISVIDTRGNQTRKIIIEEAFGRKIKFGWDIHMDKETNTIFVPCRSMPDSGGLLAISVQGQPLWLYPLDHPWGITEIYGTLFVADGIKRFFHLLSKTGCLNGRRPIKDEICGQPRSIHYGQDGRLYQGFHGVDNKRNLIFVYTVTID